MNSSNTLRKFYDIDLGGGYSSPSEEVLGRVRKQYEKETGKGWMVIPVSHGQEGYASWEYQLWLEEKAYVQLNNKK